MDWSNRVEQDGEVLFRQHYPDLLGLARAIRRQYARSNTLLTGDLLHEAYLRLNTDKAFSDIRHFKASVAVAMRHIAIDRARKRLAQKRGGEAHHADLEESDEFAIQTHQEAERTLTISLLLDELNRLNPRQAQVFNCRYFAGYSASETAIIINMNEKTVQRDWQSARHWLKERLSDTV